MTATAISNIYVPQVYNDLISNNLIEETALVKSRAVLNTPNFNKIANEGITGTIRFWNDLSRVTPNLSTDSAADVAVGLNITQGYGNYRKMFLNQGWAVADLVEDIATDNVMQHIKDRTGAYWQAIFEKKVIASLQGVLADNIANDASDMVVDISGTNTANASSALALSKTVILNAAMSMGDQYGRMTTLIVHPAVYTAIAKDVINVQKVDVDTGNRPSFIVPTYMGLEIIVSSELPVTAAVGAGGSDAAAKYLSILCGPGAVLWGNGSPLHPSAVQREEAQGNGAGVETLFERKEWIIQPNGYSFTSNTLTGIGVTDAQLKLAANWDRLVERRAVALTFITTNV